MKKFCSSFGQLIQYEPLVRSKLGWPDECISRPPPLGLLVEIIDSVMLLIVNFPHVNWSSEHKFLWCWTVTSISHASVHRNVLVSRHSILSVYILFHPWLQVLASYVNPSGEVPKNFEECIYMAPTEKVLLPPTIPELLSQSCLVPAISSYLRNDSVLDMARHIPLYRALLELLRGIAVCPSLVPLLLPLDKENNTDSTSAVGILLDKMRLCVDTYANRLK